MQWYYAVGGKQQGPVEQEELVALIQAGKVGPNDYVWNQGMGSQWARTSSVPELFPQQASEEAATPPAMWSDAAAFASATANRDLMAQARGCLSGKWGVSIGMLLIYMVISIVLGFIPLVGGIISMVISGPLVLGIMIFFLAIARQETASVGMLFQGFSRFGTAFLTCLLVGIFVLLWALPGIVLCIVAFVMMVRAALGGGGQWGVGAIILMVVGGVGAAIPAIIAQYRYAMTYFIVADTADIGALEAIRRSKRMMMTSKWKFFCLQCRFIGWSLLCVLTLGIGLLWLWPYMMTSMAQFYEDLRAGQKG